MEQAGVQLVAQGAAAFGADMATAEKAVAGFGASADKAADLVQDAAGRWRTSTGRFATDAEKAAAGVAPLGASAKEAGDKAKDAGDDAEKGGHGFKVFGEIVTGALREIGKIATQAFLEAGKATVGFLKDSVSLAGDFEAGMKKFQAVAGASVDTKGLDQFRGLFIQLGKELPVSTSEVEQAAIEMVSGGIDPAIVAGGALRQTLNFAAASGLSLADAAATSAKFLAGWTSSAATTDEKVAFLAMSTDTLTKAAAASSTTAAELRLGLFNVQGAAQALGAPFADVTATLASLAPAFESSAQAGTALNVFMTRLVPSTNPATDAMKALGIITTDNQNLFFDSQGTFLGMANAAQVLKDKMGGLTDEQKISQLHTLFGNDAMKVGNLLMQDGAAGIEAMKTKMAEANGVTATAALMHEGYNTALENAKGSVEALQITIGSYLLPVLTDLLNNYIAPAINAVSNFAEAFFKMAPAIQASDDPIQTFLNALKVAAPGLLDFIVAIEGIKDAVTPAVEEIMRLADAFGSGGLGNLIDTLVSDIGAALPGIETALLDWGQALVDWIAPYIPPLLDALGDIVNAAWGWVQEQAPEWAKQLLAWASELVDWIAPMIPPALVELGKLGQQLIDWIGEQVKPLIASFIAWKDAFIAWIPGATVTFLAEWPKMFDQFLDWIGREAGPLLAKLGDWALSFIGWIVPMIPGFLLALGGIALAIGTWVVETAAVLSKKIVEVWVPAILEWIATDAIPKLGTALNDFLKVFQGWITDAQTALAREMIKVGTAVIGGIKKGIEDAWNGLTHWLSGMMSGLVSAAMDAIGAHSPATAFIPVGSYTVQGIMQGITNTIPALSGVIDTMTSSMIDGLKKNREKLMDEIIKMGDELKAQAAAIATEIQAATGDAFGATASINRQKSGNLQAVGKLSPAQQAGVQAQIDAAEEIAQAMNDPAEGAKYFAFRSKQLLELAQLSSQLNDDLSGEQRAAAEAQLKLWQDGVAAINADEKAGIMSTEDADTARVQSAMRIAELQTKIAGDLTEQQRADITAQYQLINAAQQAEMKQFSASQEATTNNTEGLIADLQKLLTNPNLPGIFDSAAIAALNSSFRQLVSPAASSQQMASSTTNNSSQRTYNMPIYTNQSPQVIQDSMAIAGSML